MGENFSMIAGLNSGEELFYLEIGKQFKAIVDYLKWQSNHETNKKLKGSCDITLDLTCPNDSFLPLHDCAKAYNGPAYFKNKYHEKLYQHFIEAKRLW